MRKEGRKMACARRIERAEFSSVDCGRQRSISGVYSKENAGARFLVMETNDNQCDDKRGVPRHLYQ